MFFVKLGRADLDDIQQGGVVRVHTLDASTSHAVYSQRATPQKMPAWATRGLALSEAQVDLLRAGGKVVVDGTAELSLVRR